MHSWAVSMCGWQPSFNFSVTSNGPVGQVLIAVVYIIFYIYISACVHGACIPMLPSMLHTSRSDTTAAGPCR